MKEWNVRRIIDVLWKGKILIIVCIVIGAIIGYVYNAKYTKPTYQSTSSIILSVSQQNAEDILDGTYKTTISAELSLNERLMNTYAEIIRSDSVLDKVIQNLNLNMTAKQLEKNIMVNPEQKSTVMKVTATANSPQEAANIVKEIDNVFFERIDELYNIKSAKVLDEPVADNTPSNIQPKKYAFLGAMVGIAIAIFILILKEYFNDNIKTEEDVEKNTKLSVLTNVEHITDKFKLVTLDEGRANTESFRVLASNIKFSNKKSVLITSNVPEEGKSIISSNLALTYASSGQKTLLIDSDMRKGTQHLLFGISNSEGLSDLIYNNEENYQKYTHKEVVENLDILTKGTANLNYSKLLFSDVIEKILNQAKEKYDFIVIDGTPSFLVADGTAIYKLVDSTVIVVKYNNTKSSDVNKINNSIKKSGGTTLGVVINDIPRRIEKYKRYSYYEDNETRLARSKHGR